MYFYFSSKPSFWVGKATLKRWRQIAKSTLNDEIMDEAMMFIEEEDDDEEELEDELDEDDDDEEEEEDPDEMEDDMDDEDIEIIQHRSVSRKRK